MRWVPCLVGPLETWDHEVVHVGTGQAGPGAPRVRVTSTGLDAPAVERVSMAEFAGYIRNFNAPFLHRTMTKEETYPNFSPNS